MARTRKTSAGATATAVVRGPGPVDSVFTAEVKGYAFCELGVDLVGVANIERFRHAPPMMSPQGILPSARSVVVMALHHPDACVEMGGMRHPQEVGPYRVQYQINSRLDEISYRLALFLEGRGYPSVPIVSSNIWRYKGYKDLNENFAPDLSHLHASVAAGLSEFGFSGLALTPEYGARQRYVTVVTEAELTPSPLLEPGSVCDNCNLCVKHCLSGALSKELDGFNEVRIEDKVYRYARKNLWRCAWGEHFDLDLDLPIPEHVDEAVILEAVRTHGLRGGEFGSCLRHCVPKALRYFDKDYTTAPRRRRHLAWNEAGLAHRGLEARTRSLAARLGVDCVFVQDAARMAGLGLDLKAYLPDAVTALVLAVRYRRPTGCDGAASARVYQLWCGAYDIARELERLGHSAILDTDLPEAKVEPAVTGVPDGWVVQTKTVLTSARLATTDLGWPAAGQPARVAAAELTADLRTLLGRAGADLVGVAPAARLDAVAAALRPTLDGETHLAARDKSLRFYPYAPEVSVQTRRILRPDDRLARARSVLVIGLRLPRATVDRAAKPPAEAIGPYAFAQYESVNLLRLLGWRAVQTLEARGYRAALSFDLLGDGATVSNPRGEQPDAFCNRFAAVASGLGRLSRGGFVVTPGYGANVRFVAVVTDAELTADPVSRDDSLTAACQACDRCSAACRTAAFGDWVEVPVDGVVERFRRIDRGRCDWSKRYSLTAAEGNQYLGWKLDIPVPETITPENLAAALRQQPAIPKYRPCNMELCILACPYSRPQAG